MKFIDRELLVFSRRLARRIARHFGIHYQAVYHVDKRRTDYKEVQGKTDELEECPRRYIELVFRKPNGKFYSIHQITDTICHELAHVLTWHENAEHSQNWRAWYKKIKDYADGKLF